ncbi:NemA protein [Uruburuella testudinis]|uniref:NemA protein n=1 Tax=Uruburuella testudinis TaxID=1282863 RepID=A0ABY4DVT9_9NEIS|nr:NemA protein [Uruburuella testudinis]UOO82829.1 NemA protein [Uruburuella testudinis]
MKQMALAAAFAAILSACTVGTPGMSVGLGMGTSIGRHVGLGTSINIPVGLDKTRAGTTNDSGINVIEEQIVTYFDAQGNTQNTVARGGFHRQLLNKRDNEYIVQDFYSDNNRKRTDPYTLSRNQLMRFRAHPDNGTLTTYAYNGNLMQQQVYQNGRLINAKY